MIRWCAYCQRYQGEVAPFDDYSMTHTICAECQASGAFRRPPSRGLQGIRAFFGRIAYASVDGGLTAREVVAEGAALGLDPIDLMLGILQPLLHQLGDLWARSEVSIAEEHRISALCGEVIQAILDADDGAYALRRVRPPDVLLVVAEGNHHVLGIRILEVLLLQRGVAAMAFHPGLPVGETVELARRLRPRVLGISAVTPDQVGAARAVAERLAGADMVAAPIVTVGGYALRVAQPIAVEAPLVPSRDVDSLLALLALGSAAPTV